MGEYSELRSESTYGTSKMMTELMLRDSATAHDFDYTALHYFNVSGADSKLRTDQSIKVVCETATGKLGQMEVFSTDDDTPDGTCVRDCINVSDLSNAHYLALCRMRSGGGNLMANCGYRNGD